MSSIIDVTALARLGDDLARAAAEVQAGARGVVSKGALNIKNDWRQNAVASARSHGRLYPYTINYELTPTPLGTSVVIGPDNPRLNRIQASYGTVLEFGSVHNPPHNDGGRALDAEEPRFVAAAETLAARALR